MIVELMGEMFCCVVSIVSTGFSLTKGDGV